MNKMIPGMTTTTTPTTKSAEKKINNVPLFKSKSHIYHDKCYYYSCDYYKQWINEEKANRECFSFITWFSKSFSIGKNSRRPIFPSSSSSSSVICYFIWKHNWVSVCHSSVSQLMNINWKLDVGVHAHSCALIFIRLKRNKNKSTQ